MRVAIRKRPRCGHSRVGTGDVDAILGPPKQSLLRNRKPYSQARAAYGLRLEANRCSPEPAAKGDLGEAPEFRVQLALFIPRRIPAVSPSFIKRNQMASVENAGPQSVHVIPPLLQALAWCIGLEEVPELRCRSRHIMFSVLATLHAVHRMDCAAVNQRFDGGYE